MLYVFVADDAVPTCTFQDLLIVTVLNGFGRYSCHATACVHPFEGRTTDVFSFFLLLFFFYFFYSSILHHCPIAFDDDFVYFTYFSFVIVPVEFPEGLQLRRKLLDECVFFGFIDILCLAAELSSKLLLFATSPKTTLKSDSNFVRLTRKQNHT